MSAVRVSKVIISSLPRKPKMKGCNTNGEVEPRLPAE
jgi:hypothetical protein